MNESFSQFVCGTQVLTDVDDWGGTYVAWRACIGSSNDAWHIWSHSSATRADARAKVTSVECVCGVLGVAGCQVKLLSDAQC